jgi:hypothetical protein
MWVVTYIVVYVIMKLWANLLTSSSGYSKIHDYTVTHSSSQYINFSQCWC